MSDPCIRDQHCGLHHSLTHRCKQCIEEFKPHLINNKTQIIDEARRAPAAIGHGRVFQKDFNYLPDPVPTKKGKNAKLWQDNQSRSRIAWTRKAPTLRRIGRTHCVSVRRLPNAVRHIVGLSDCNSDAMAADLFTKAFTNKDKWIAVSTLIGFAGPDTLREFTVTPDFGLTLLKQPQLKAPQQATAKTACVARVASKSSGSHVQWSTCPALVARSSVRDDQRHRQASARANLEANSRGDNRVPGPRVPAPSGPDVPVREISYLQISIDLGQLQPVPAPASSEQAGSLSTLPAPRTRGRFKGRAVMLPQNPPGESSLSQLYDEATRYTVRSADARNAYTQAAHTQEAFFTPPPHLRTVRERLSTVRQHNLQAARPEGFDQASSSRLASIRGRPAPAPDYDSDTVAPTIETEPAPLGAASLFIMYRLLERIRESLCKRRAQQAEAADKFHGPPLTFENVYQRNQHNQQFPVESMQLSSSYHEGLALTTDSPKWFSLKRVKTASTFSIFSSERLSAASKSCEQGFPAALAPVMEQPPAAPSPASASNPQDGLGVTVIEVAMQDLAPMLREDASSTVPGLAVSQADAAAVEALAREDERADAAMDVDSSGNAEGQSPLGGSPNAAPGHAEGQPPLGGSPEAAPYSLTADTPAGPLSVLHAPAEIVQEPDAELNHDKGPSPLGEAPASTTPEASGRRNPMCVVIDAWTEATHRDLYLPAWSSTNDARHRQLLANVSTPALSHPSVSWVYTARAGFSNHSDAARYIVHRMSPDFVLWCMCYHAGLKCAPVENVSVLMHAPHAEDMHACMELGMNSPSAHPLAANDITWLQERTLRDQTSKKRLADISDPARTAARVHNHIDQDHNVLRFEQCYQPPNDAGLHRELPRFPSNRWTAQISGSFTFNPAHPLSWRYEAANGSQASAMH